MAGVWSIRGGGHWLLRWTVRLVLLGAVVLLGFAPYDHEVGGECRIVPIAERSVRAQIADEIAEVHVDEDQWLDAGELIVSLAVRDEIAAVETAKASLAKAKANLDLLQNGATPEEIAIAEQNAEMARVNLAFTEGELARTAELASQSAGAKKNEDKARQAHDLAKAQLVTAEEQLKHIKAGAREEEIRAAVAEVHRIEAELALNEKLVNLGRIVAPIAGRIVTPNIRERTGHYVREGDLIAVIHDDSEYCAEIAADEAAAVEVKVGMTVNIKLYGMNGKSLTGTVERISTNVVDEAEFEQDRVNTDRESRTAEARSDDNMRVARIRVALDGQELGVRAGMTGQGRVNIGTGRVWEALARPLSRFLFVEVWSWLP